LRLYASSVDYVDKTQKENCFVHLGKCLLSAHRAVSPNSMFGRCRHCLSSW